MSDRKAIRRALLSVYDKSRLVEIGKALQEAGVEILSTGSTCKTLLDNGVKVTEVSEYTGFPEIMGGRVKTLHPRIHSGILADQNNPEHLAKIAELDIAPSAAAARMAKAVISNSNEVMPVCAWVNGEFGITGVYLGVEAQIGKSGVTKVIETKLTSDELSSLKVAAEAVRTKQADVKDL